MTFLWLINAYGIKAGYISDFQQVFLALILIPIPFSSFFYYSKNMGF